MKKTICLLAFILLLSLTAVAEIPTGNENVPYYSYTYNESEESLRVPFPFVPERTISGAKLGIGDFSDSVDMSYDGNGRMYVADTGNNRIVIIGVEGGFKAIINDFEYNGKKEVFNGPAGVFVLEDRIYISDTENERIVVLDSEYRTAGVITKPVMPSLAENYRFFPQRLAVDRAGRVFVVCREINRGIVELDKTGAFISFLGAPPVSISWSDRIWRILSTSAQKENSENFVPTEYSSVSIDKKDFLLATSSSLTSKPISRINMRGENVLKTKNGEYPQGDMEPIVSTFVDIAANDEGFYFALDSYKGRIFSYNQDGQLLFVFGGNGTRIGAFRTPSAIELVGDHIWILDKLAGRITVFRPTAFGSTVLRATELQNKGKNAEAYTAWDKVIESCSNYNYAYVMQARIDLHNNDYKEAFKKINATDNKYYYSLAFSDYREFFINEYFYLMLLGAAGLALALFIVHKVRERSGHITKVPYKLSQSTTQGNLRYGMHIIFHPLDGFWDLKRERKNTFKSAVIIFVSFLLAYGIQVQLTGKLFYKGEKNVLLSVASIAVPFLLWCVSNWCFTTLMDGKGKLTDVFISSSYALIPYTLAAIPLGLLSNVLITSEASIYNMVKYLVIIWTFLLLFLGMIMTHDYSVKKGLGSVILTVLGICIILFLALLFFSIVQEVFGFIYSAYLELSFR